MWLFRLIFFKMIRKLHCWWFGDKGYHLSSLSLLVYCWLKWSLRT